MPDIDGFGLQQQLAGRTEQIVFLTGNGDVPMCARAMKSGAVDFLDKPVDDDVLIDAVSCALERSAALVSAFSDRQAARARVAKLTPRERAVFARVIARRVRSLASGLHSMKPSIGNPAAIPATP